MMTVAARSAAEAANLKPRTYAEPAMMTLAAYPHLNRTRSTLNVVDFSFELIFGVKWFYERKKRERGKFGAFLLGWDLGEYCAVVDFFGFSVLVVYVH